MQIWCIQQPLAATLRRSASGKTSRASWLGKKKYIANWDKQFLNVDWSANKGDNTSPDSFLKVQVEKWGKFWSSPSDNEIDRIVNEVSEFIKRAQESESTQPTEDEQGFNSKVRNVNRKYKKGYFGF